MEKSRDLLKKPGDIKGTFHARMDMKKERNGQDLTEAEEIQKKWQEYTELYKKALIITVVWSVNQRQIFWNGKSSGPLGSITTKLMEVTEFQLSYLKS